MRKCLSWHWYEFVSSWMLSCLNYSRLNYCLFELLFVWTTKWFELCFFAWRGWIFENHTLKARNILFKKVVLPGRVKCGGTEEEIVVAHGCRKRKKANMWPGRGNSGGSWPPAFPPLSFSPKYISLVLTLLIGQNICIIIHTYIVKREWTTRLGSRAERAVL